MIDIKMTTSPPLSLSSGVMPSQPTGAPVQQAAASASFAQQAAPVQQAVPAQATQPAPQPMAPVQQPSGGVVLKKGQKTQLVSPTGGQLTMLKAGLAWQTNLDLDVECFMLGDNGSVVGDQWFVFYNQCVSPDGAVTHSGDVRDGSLPGDDEVITIDLLKLNPQVKKLVFVVTINEARERGLNFSMVQDARIHIVDCSSNQELCSFRLTDYYQNVNSMVVGEIYNHNGQWKFNPVGDGLAADLYDLCRRYGVNIAE